MMKLLKFLERLLPLAFFVFVVFAFDTPRLALFTLAAAVIHESGHVLFGASRKIVHLLPSPHPTGFRITPKRSISYKDELILLIGGPVSNIIVFFLSFFTFYITKKESFFDFAFVNFLTAFANLLPIKGYDGYRITETAILIKKGDAFDKISHLSHLSFAFTAILTFLSLYLLLKLGEGYWIFALFFASTVYDLKKLIETGNF